MKKQKQDQKMIRYIFTSFMMGLCGYRVAVADVSSAVESQSRSEIELRVPHKMLLTETKGAVKNPKIESQRIAFPLWHKFYSPIGQKIEPLESHKQGLKPQSRRASHFRNRPLFRSRKLGPKRYSDPKINPIKRVYFRSEKGVFVAYQDLAPHLSLSDINRYQFRRNRRQTLKAPIQTKHLSKKRTLRRHRFCRRKW